MSTSARRVHYTYAEYRAIEDESSIRHEYLDGEIYAVAGGTPDHAALAAAIIGVLRPLLPPSCRAFSSDLRVRVVASGLSTYPDVSVVCGRTLRAADDALAVTNPVLLVEITSSSTEDYDRGEKLGQARTSSCSPSPRRSPSTPSTTTRSKIREARRMRRERAPL